jgi:hypothetical protein
MFLVAQSPYAISIVNPFHNTSHFCHGRNMLVVDESVNWMPNSIIKLRVLHFVVKSLASKPFPRLLSAIVQTACSVAGLQVSHGWLFLPQ